MPGRRRSCSWCSGLRALFAAPSSDGPEGFGALQGRLSRYEFREGRDREGYVALVRAAARLLAASVLRDPEVLADTGSVYHVRTRDGRTEMRWADGGRGRHWNLCVHTDGRAGWDACVIDAGAPGPGMLFEICYESSFIRTEYLARLVRSHPGGDAVRINAGSRDVGQQSGLTLAMVRDVLAHAARARNAPENVPDWAWGLFA